MKLFAALTKYCILSITLGWMAMASAVSLNQTADVSPILSEEELPFSIRIELADFKLKDGFHSGAEAAYHGKWLMIAGRKNGLHSFNTKNPESNFPPQKQNTSVYVVDPQSGKFYARALSDSSLSQHQIDLLSVTSPQCHQDGKTLYMTGGYGVDTATNTFTTKDVLTAIDIPALMHWVQHPLEKGDAASYIRQISNPVFKITGGYMTKIGKVTLLVFGQDFEGFYFDFARNSQVYSRQVRRFIIEDDGVNLSVKVLDPLPRAPNPNYRRRDLNILPVMRSNKEGCLVPGLVALSGVFTLSNGIWTVPVCISATGKSHMKSANSPKAFKQGMNNYLSAAIGLYSKNKKSMYNILLGGLSYGSFEDGVFKTDPDIGFTNQITTVKIDQKGRFSQYLMKAEYPTVFAPFAPGKPLLFGTAAQFMPLPLTPMFSNGVLQLDTLIQLSLLTKSPVLLGYIVGGIESVINDTTDERSQTAASPYVFKVILEPRITR
jgi:hypothetical protein